MVFCFVFCVYEHEKMSIRERNGNQLAALYRHTMLETALICFYTYLLKHDSAAFANSM
jgi:hypothetical protein